MRSRDAPQGRFERGAVFDSANPSEQPLQLELHQRGAVFDSANPFLASLWRRVKGRVATRRLVSGAAPVVLCTGVVHRTGSRQLLLFSFAFHHPKRRLQVIKHSQLPWIPRGTRLLRPLRQSMLSPCSGVARATEETRPPTVQPQERVHRVRPTPERRHASLIQTKAFPELVKSRALRRVSRFFITPMEPARQTPLFLICAAAPRHALTLIGKVNYLVEHALPIIHATILLLQSLHSFASLLGAGVRVQARHRGMEPPRQSIFCLVVATPSRHMPMPLHPGLRFVALLHPLRHFPESLLQRLLPITQFPREAVRVGFQFALPGLVPLRQ